MPHHIPQQSNTVDDTEKLTDEIDQIRLAAWSGWERSQVDKVKTTEKEIVGGPGGGRSEETIATESQVGDPSFLRVILDCNRRDATLRGVERSKRVQTHLGQTMLDIDLFVAQIETALAADQQALSGQHLLPNWESLNDQPAG